MKKIQNDKSGRKYMLKCRKDTENIEPKIV